MAAKQSLKSVAPSASSAAQSFGATSGRLAASQLTAAHQRHSTPAKAQNKSSLSSSTSRKDSIDGEFGTTQVNRHSMQQPKNHSNSVRSLPTKQIAAHSNKIAFRSEPSSSTSASTALSAVASSSAPAATPSPSARISIYRSNAPTAHQLAGVLAKHKMVANQLNVNTEPNRPNQRNRPFVKSHTFTAGSSVGGSGSGVQPTTITTGGHNPDLNQLRSDNIELLTHSTMVGRKLDNLRADASGTSGGGSGDTLKAPSIIAGRSLVGQKHSSLPIDRDSASSSDDEPLDLSTLTEEQARQLYLKHPYLIEPQHPTRSDGSHAVSSTPTTLSDYNRRLMLKEQLDRQERKRHKLHDSGISSLDSTGASVLLKSEIPEEVAQLLQRSARARLDLSNQQSAAASNKRSGVVSSVGSASGGGGWPLSSTYNRLTNAYRSDSLDSPLNGARLPPYRRSFTPGVVLGVERSQAWVPMPLTRSSTLERINSGQVGGSGFSLSGGGSVGGGVSGGAAATATSSSSSAYGPASGSICVPHDASSGNKPRSDYANRKLALLNKSRSSHSIGKSD